MDRISITEFIEEFTLVLSSTKKIFASYDLKY